MYKNRHEEGSIAVAEKPASAASSLASCPYHKHEMAVSNSRLICPEPGCNVIMAMPAPKHEFKSLEQAQLDLKAKQPPPKVDESDKQPEPEPEPQPEPKHVSHEKDLPYRKTHR